MMGRTLACENPVGPDSSPWRASPHSPPPRVCRLLDEAAMCVGEMQAWQKMDPLREASAAPRMARMVGANLPETSDIAVLEAEQQLVDYMSRCAPDSRATAARSSLDTYLPSVPRAHSRIESSAPHCPAAAAWQHGHSMGVSPATFPRCECDPRSLLPHICELDDLVESRAAEIHALQGELRLAQVVASAEFKAFTEENEALARRSKEDAAITAKLRTESSALTWTLEVDKHRSSELEIERKGILKRLGESERGQAYAQRSREEEEAEFQVERRQAQERCDEHEDAVEKLTKHLECVEQEWSDTEAAVSQLELHNELEASGADVSDELASAPEASHQRKQLRELEAHLSAEETAVSATASADMARQAMLRTELSQAHQQSVQIRAAESSLAAQLRTSSRRAEQTQQKALSVARELVDASQGIAWLRAEAAAQGALREELQEVRRNIAWRRQHLQELQRETKHLDISHSSSGGVDDLVGLLDEDCDPYTVFSPVQRDLDRARNEQVSEVNEALQTAWEAETREGRSIQRRISALQSRLQPLQKQLVRMTEVASLWRESLRRSAAAGKLHALNNGAGLPRPPEDAKWDDASGAQVAMQMLCACVAALTAETSRQVESVKRSDGAQDMYGASIIAALHQERSPASEEALRAERIALEEELERLTPSIPKKLKAHTEAITTPSVSSISREVQHDTATSYELQEPPATPLQKRRSVHEPEAPAWTSSPRPLGRARAGTSILRSRSVGGFGACGCSMASTVSSVSLHDGVSQRVGAECAGRPRDMGALRHSSGHHSEPPLRWRGGGRPQAGSRAGARQHGTARPAIVVAGLGPVSRRTGQLRHIPRIVRRNADVPGSAPVLDNPSERFDTDSVYRR